MDDLEKLLPNEIRALAARTSNGKELVIPFAETLRAIEFANKHLIAVLGVEAFRILDAGLGVETYSGYGFNFDGDWPNFVRLNNEASLEFVNENPFGKGYGYILTATSEAEFKALPKQIKVDWP